MKKWALVVLIGLLAGCASMPWNVTETISKFDGSTAISVGPAWITDSLIGLGLHRTTKMEPGDVILTATYRGASLFGDEPTLLFKLDGDIIALNSFDDHTKIKTNPGMVANGILIPATNWSSKRYRIKRDFVGRILRSKQVFVKLLLSDSYSEGDFKAKDGGMGAKTAFSNFYKHIQ